MNMSLHQHPHRRFNILTGEWILVSPHRTKRPWQGKVEKKIDDHRPPHDENCYLCPGNKRTSGEVNPNYTSPYSFVNDFSALLNDTPQQKYDQELLKAKSERGICKVICFSPDHSLTLPLMSVEDITAVIKLWQQEYKILGDHVDINHVQIFENKGQMMGCSNPHPHGQIWAQESVPLEVQKKTTHFKRHFQESGRNLLEDYLSLELKEDKRVLYADDYMVIIVPYWAVWPFEAMIIPKKRVAHLNEFSTSQEKSFAKAIKHLTTIYDNLFETSFPYSAGIHQAPTDGEDHPEWHLHMSFYPPLLRSAIVKKFMVGYELFAEPQRDITAEQAANRLKELSNVHYTKR
ncbi:galactose-1-phosphate uridylyltransferase [Gangjinia marincola]|uniref:Galactose-1-phosphate uridylyltransferase n=1 Tax=Gangjinia marincola TaxID=578463 RepID=A0ABP3XY74_9FLAO